MSIRRRAIAVAVVFLLPGSIAAQPPATGGFVEPTTSTSVRPLLTASEIQSLLPARGAFVFPAPYLTQAIRITNATDCAALIAWTTSGIRIGATRTIMPAARQCTCS
jgi:hypothetical protein